MRRIFELSRKEGLTHKEIADITGTQKENVAKHISNALAILRIKLGSSLKILFLIV